MKKFFAACAIAILATGTPAIAQSYRNPVGPGLISLNDAAGQPVYDVHGMNVGVIRGVTDETGQRSAIISADKAGPGNHDILIIAEELQPDGRGAWLSPLTADSILDMPPYIPGRMLPL